MHASVCIHRGLGSLAVAVAQIAAAGWAAANTPDHEAFFESRVRPLLVARCQECHGSKLSEAGLRLDSRPLKNGGLGVRVVDTQAIFLVVHAVEPDPNARAFFGEVVPTVDPANGVLDQRIGGTFVYYPQPFGIPYFDRCPRRGVRRVAVTGACWRGAASRG